MNYIRKKRRNKKGFTLVELIVVITILGILMAIVVPSIMSYFKDMDMIKANESARQIYVAAQNKLTAMKANGQLDKTVMTEYDLKEVPARSAAKEDENGTIKYFYMNTTKAKAFLSQAGQSLDAELVSDKASILIELDPVNGNIYGVFFASYSDSSADAPFSYAGTDKLGLRGGTKEFCESDDLRSQEKARIGYYGGENAKTEYESSLKTPMLEVINGEELLVKISSYGQPEGFLGYKITLTGEKGGEYQTYIEKDNLVKDPVGTTLEGNYYTLLLDSLAEGYSMEEIVTKDFKGTKNFQGIVPGDNMAVSVMAVSSTTDTDEKSRRSAANEAEVSSLFAEKTEDVGKTKISVANARHLQNLDKIAGKDFDGTDTIVQQIKDIDWKNTVAYYNGLTGTGTADKDQAGNADKDRALKAGNENAAFTPVSSGKYTFTAEIPQEGKSLTDVTDAGYKISNLPVKGTGDAGLFASFSGSILHVNLVNVKVEGTGNVGALVGNYTADSSNQIRDCKVYLDKNADPSQLVFDYAAYTISGGTEGTGGLIGCATKGQIKDSFAAINVKGGTGANSAAGGFVGILKNAQISGSYSSGQVMGEAATALGGFAGSATELSQVEQCYNTGDITSEGRSMGSFLGEYLGGNTDIPISESYTTGLKRIFTVENETITTLGLVGNEVSGEVGADCFYLGSGASYGAEGLNAAQLGSLETVSDGRRLNDIYTVDKGWRYPENYGTGNPVSETTKYTHPYYLSGALTENDTVFPYPARTQQQSANPVPVPHYGDWSLKAMEEDVNLQLFYYEKYGENDYGYYLKDRSVGSDLDPTKTILETGYGLIVKEENGKMPKLEGIQAYYNGDTTKSVGDDLTLTAMGDFYLVVDGVYYYGMKLEGSQMDASQITKGSWQEVMTKSYKESTDSNGSITPYNYISFTYGEKEFFFNPCFAKALGNHAEGSRTPEWFGNRNSAFEVRTEAQFKCLDGFGEYESDGAFYYFRQDRTKIALSHDAWIPLCPNGFMGSYEGNGGTISELSIKNASSVTPQTNLGLFDTIGNDYGAPNADSGSTIRNLTVETSAVNTDPITAKKPNQDDAYFGILAGKCSKSSWIENCDTVLNATINFSNGNAGNKFDKPYYRVYIGGLVGYSDGTIKGCQVRGEGKISADANQEVCGGGFAGLLDKNSLVETGTDGTQCLTNTTVRLNGYVSGFAAENKGRIYHAYSGGNIEGSQLYSAGFVVLNHVGAVIEECSSGSSVNQPIQVSMEKSQTGTNSSTAGFVGINGGTIRDSRVFARVETWGTYTAGFVLDNAGHIEGCDTYAYVKNNGNLAAGFVSSNEKVVYTLVGTDNIRREPFTGNGQIKNCNVYSIETKRETVNIEAGKQVAGFVLTNATSIDGCGVQASMKTLGGENIHASGAGFAVTNNGVIGRSYTNSIVTITTSSPGHDTQAAGFIFKNSGLIYESYADCMTTAKSDNNSQAAGFVFEDKNTETSTQNIQDCYALLEVSAEGYTKGKTPKTSQAAGFVINGSTQGTNILNSYCAVSLSGTTQYGFAPSSVKTENCYYLKYSDNATTSGTGTPLSEENLRTLKLGNSWEAGKVSTTHPNSGSLKGMKYPYPKLVDMDHYGDWPEIVDNDGAIFYYEQYQDNTKGIYFLKSNYSAYSTLDDKRKIIKWGYGLIVKGDSNKSEVTIYARNASGQSEKIESNNINSWVKKEWNDIDSPLGKDYHFRPFKDGKLTTLQEKIKSSSYQYLYTKVESTKTYNLFNPLFAAAINTNSYVAFDANNMPEASFGKPGDPFEIRHADQFHNMSNRGYESKGSNYHYFEQTHDVNLADNKNTRVWNPSASGHRKNGSYTQDDPYIGNYEGNGRKISEFALPTETEDLYVGLFGYLGNGEGSGSVSDLILQVEDVNVTLKDGSAAGLLAGYVAKNSKITGCQVIPAKGNKSITFQGKLDMAGGVAGGSEGIILNTTLTGEGSLQVAGSNTQMMFGGLIGVNKGTLRNGNVDGIKISSKVNRGYVAGLSGLNQGVISNSSVRNAEVRSSSDVKTTGGSAAGFVIENLGNVTNSSVEKTQVYAEQTAAGFVYNNGHNASGTLDGNPSLDNSQDNSKARIIGCVYNGNGNDKDVITLSADAAGFVRYNFGTIEDSHAISGIVKTEWGKEGNIYEKRGLAGFCHTNLGTIMGNTYTTMDVTGQSGNVQVAGFVVDNQGSILGNSINLVSAGGRVSGITGNAVGFAIWNSGTIDYARYHGGSISAVSNEKSAAGFVLENDVTGQISHSKVAGTQNTNIMANEHGAGFAVINEGTIDSSQAQRISVTFQADKNESNAAGFVCENKQKAVVSRSTVQGSIVKYQSSEKGIGGFAASNAGEISNQCVASVSITTNNNAAGFVGTNESTGEIRGSSLTPIRVIGSDVKIAASGDRSSGFAGINKGTIEYASVELKGTSQIGQSSNSAGFVFDNQNLIRNSQIVAASIKGSTKISGFAMTNSSKGNIQKCVVGSKIELKADKVYGFIETNEGSILSSSMQAKVAAGNKGYGFAGTNETKGLISECKVTGTDISGGTTETAGFMGTNKGQLSKVSVEITGDIVGQNVYGFLKENQESGIITDASLKGNAVKGTGATVGFANANRGRIEAQEEFLVDIDVINTGSGSAEGFVYENAGTITGKRQEGEAEAVLVTFSGNVQAGNDMGASGFVNENSGAISYAAVVSEEGIRAEGATSGFVNENRKKIDHCYVHGNVSSQNDVASGFADTNVNSGSISSSYVEGNVSSSGNGGAAGFAGKNQGTITDGFTVCEVEHKGSSYSSKASGFVLDNLRGVVSNSYSSSAVSASNDKVQRYAFEGEAGIATKVYYLAWPGVSGCIKEKSAQGLTKDKLKNSSKKLGDAWKTPEEGSSYLYPVIKGLPVPTTMLDDIAAYGVAYYEKSGEQYNVYDVDAEGKVTDGLKHNGKADEWGYAVFILKNSGVSPTVDASGITMEPQKSFSSGRYEYYKITNLPSYENLVNVSVSDGKTGYYIDQDFACAIELAEYDADGKPLETRLGKLAEDGIPLGISLEAQLGNIKGENLKRSYVQLNDIALSGTSAVPIGGSDGTTGFQGKYDGAGYVISGLDLKMTTKNMAAANSNWGVFGANAGQILNTHVTGKIDGGKTSSISYFGGLVGRNLVGGEITLSSADVDITFTSGNFNIDTKAGGFVGYNEGVIQRSYASGDITNGGALGGFVGEQNTQDGKKRAEIVNCYSTGITKKDKSNFEPGQFAGNANNDKDNDKTNKVDTSLYQNCFAYNEAIKKDKDKVSDINEYSFIGNGRNPGINNVINCYILSKDLTGKAGTPLSAIAMALQKSFPTFDFSENGIWTMGEYFPELVENRQRYEYAAYNSAEPITMEEEEKKKQEKSNADESELVIEEPETETKAKETESESSSQPATEKESEKETKAQTEKTTEGQQETKAQTETEKKGQEETKAQNETDKKGQEETKAQTETEKKGQEETKAQAETEKKQEETKAQSEAEKKSQQETKAQAETAKKEQKKGKAQTGTLAKGAPVAVGAEKIWQNMKQTGGGQNEGN